MVNKALQKLVYEYILYSIFLGPGWRGPVFPGGSQTSLEDFQRVFGTLLRMTEGLSVRLGPLSKRTEQLQSSWGFLEIAFLESLKFTFLIQGACANCNNYRSVFFPTYDKFYLQILVVLSLIDQALWNKYIW
jgi:hypothetical protein